MTKPAPNHPWRRKKVDLVKERKAFHNRVQSRKFQQRHPNYAKNMAKARREKERKENLMRISKVIKEKGLEWLFNDL